MEIVAAILVVAGYAGALPVLVRFRAVFAERRTRWFAAFVAAMVALVVGHALAGRPLASAVNAVALVILAAAWWRSGRRRRLPSR